MLAGKEMVMKRMIWLSLLLTGCAGFSRRCSSTWASATGADWLVVQHRNDGSVYKCWKLLKTSVDNEPQSDGIYWQSATGHLIHLSGWYTRIQVQNNQFTSAAKEAGIDITICE